MKLKPNLVLVKVDPPVEKDEHGIYIQEEWKKNPPFGTVEATGHAVTICKPGDRVEFVRFSAIQSGQGADLRYCREDEILAVLP